jgi:hypothetical protein
MADTEQRVVRSTRLDYTRRRIERWRETRRHGHVSMPPALWNAAVAAVRQHGLYRTARTLRVDYGALKKHLEASAGEVPALASPTFVELAPSGPTSPGACVIEIDGPRGTLRIRVGGLALRDLVAVAQLWGEAS